jgi:hypothetical protein
MKKDKEPVRQNLHRREVKEEVEGAGKKAKIRG